ncbi:MAG TPA: deoxyguanosinetriphosphate triphosphohydrolase [Steroidobacteraceae bacterium]|nr:deoxyguanosinetriphosphate triphosphohydrolase [Steroidobacteraceae bacterium]
MNEPLAPYAAIDERSRGRRFPEAPPRFRSEFQRDRDRIIHSNAFRRLVYKTQVFVNHEGDLYRTRITHSLEVAQIGRTVARALRINETLTEAICLAHDLGHTPFGHAGQDALNECMRDYGGFEHNLQSLRVVDELEERYADFSGLNLTFECREGVLKHCSVQNARLLGDVGERFLNRTQPGLEAQLSNLADAIAYNNHDVDDGVRAGLINVDELRDVRVFARLHSEVTEKYPAAPARRQLYETIRRMVDFLVSDLIVHSQRVINDARVDSIDSVRLHARPLITLSDEALEQHHELKRFLRTKLYNHPRVRKVMDEASATLKTLFEAYMKDPSRLPPEHQSLATRAEAEGGKPARARVVADYVAGMTDRFAYLERARIASMSENANGVK